MGNKYEEVHEAILCVLHALAFGHPGLCDDAKERMLRAWYLEFQKTIEETIDKASMTKETHVTSRI